MKFSDETVMAYADGELTGPEREAFEAALAEDAGLRTRVEEHRAFATLIGGAHSGVLAEPVPERLIAAATRDAEVVSLTGRRAARPRIDWRTVAAMAACLVVGVTAGVLLRGADGGALVRTTDGGLAAAGALDRALDRQLASDAQGVVKVGLSFRTAEGGYCRTFRVAKGEGLAGLACREDGRWRVRLAMASAPPAGEGGYRTAATETPPQVLEAVEAIIAGAPLDAAGEAAARAKGWKP